MSFSKRSLRAHFIFPLVGVHRNEIMDNTEVITFVDFETDCIECTYLMFTAGRMHIFGCYNKPTVIVAKPGFNLC